MARASRLHHFVGQHSSRLTSDGAVLRLQQYALLLPDLFIIWESATYVG